MAAQNKKQSMVLYVLIVIFIIANIISVIQEQTDRNIEPINIEPGLEDLIESNNKHV